MFGRHRKVRIPVPGSPVVVVDEACHKAEVEETLRHNIELAKVLLTLIPPKSSDRPEPRSDEREEQSKPPPDRGQRPESSLEPIGEGKGDGRGNKQRAHLVTLSIGVAESKASGLRVTDQRVVVTVASEMKTVAKSQPGSYVAIGRRHSDARRR